MDNSIMIPQPDEKKMTTSLSKEEINTVETKYSGVNSVKQMFEKFNSNTAPGLVSKPSINYKNKQPLASKIPIPIKSETEKMNATKPLASETLKAEDDSTTNKELSTFSSESKLAIKPSLLEKRPSKSYIDSAFKKTSSVETIKIDQNKNFTQSLQEQHENLLASLNEEQSNKSAVLVSLNVEQQSNNNTVDEKSLSRSELSINTDTPSPLQQNSTQNQISDTTPVTPVSKTRRETSRIKNQGKNEVVSGDFRWMKQSPTKGNVSSSVSDFSGAQNTSTCCSPVKQLATSPQDIKKPYVAPGTPRKVLKKTNEPPPQLAQTKKKNLATEKKNLNIDIPIEEKSTTVPEPSMHIHGEEYSKIQNTVRNLVGLKSIPTGQFSHNKQTPTGGFVHRNGTVKDRVKNLEGNGKR
ncbi:hypothetical protein HK099_002141 [Clydaea vesicula]|uniref:Uncharacterized protein n=1 Tax=Clydaea vesicula TaxID=447962 RepID=A0AAD5TTA9_9FUNG|nr:hypothetical protein HK099_002141 [Clydaea vesicula]